MRMGVISLNNDVFLLSLKDSNGVNWGLWVYHHENIKQIYTREVDIEGVESLRIDSFNGSFKIKVSTSGQIVTYRVDDLG